MGRAKKARKGGGGLKGAGFHDLMVCVDNDAVFSDEKQVFLSFLLRRTSLCQCAPVCSLDR
jgi:hypothetical protein